MVQDKTYWTQTKEEVLQALASSPAGLTQAEAGQRLGRSGPNRLVRERTVTFLGVLKEEFTEPMILLLLVVGAVYSIWGETRDALTILVIVALLVFIEIGTEYRAKKAVAALRKLSPASVPLVRDGRYRSVRSEEVVHGDILVLEAGGRAPADARCLESFGLQVDESALTGEAAPVDKDDGVLPVETPLAERVNMVFAGTTVTRGRGTAVVTVTGMNTELGKITGLVLEAKEPKTPLQLAMKQLAGLLVWVAAFFSLLVPAVGFLQGKPLKDMVLTGLSLSFATIPEELPIVVTMVLGVGAYALSRRNVLVKRLRSAETLGSVTIIATDKTGTLTENRLTLSAMASEGSIRAFTGKDLSPGELFVLRAGMLTSGMKRMRGDGYSGDPVDRAIIEAAALAGILPSELEKEYQLRKEFSFDSRRKLMSTTYQTAEGGFVFVKGAPEAVLERSTDVFHEGLDRPRTEADTKAIRQQVEAMAGEAMRVIAFGCKSVTDPSRISQDEAETGLTFAGLVGLADPPRQGVKEAIQEIEGAGVRTVVVSGDHPLTVEKVAARVGIATGGKAVTGADLAVMNDEQLRDALWQTSLFARITAEQKLRIVSTLKSMGQVVAVTGDGINDAPALKSADIGVAMGETGTEVARQAADMVLRDDSFISIAAGVREGRKIFDNLKKGITYYLCVKVALVLSFLASLVVAVPFPFAPIQIILLELFMDLAASATFVAEPIEADAMKRPPRAPKAPFVDREMVRSIALGSVSLAGAVIINYLFALYSGRGQTEAQTLAFATWLMGHVFLAFNMRSRSEPLWRVGLISNRVMLAWAGAVLVFLVLVTGVATIRESVRVAPLAVLDWTLAVTVPLATIFWMELRKTLRRGHGVNRSGINTR
ncbi:MAG: cation-transporting P-type ATPase [Chloroflexi bacterium]|nr:cation-transporting P-type ATPase [Chloroflexota bacterium]